MQHSCCTFTRAIPYACDISCECIARMQHSLATDLKSHAASLYLKLTTVRDKEYTMSENRRFCVQSDMQISQKPPTHCQKSPNSARLAFKLNIGNLRECDISNRPVFRTRIQDSQSAKLCDKSPTARIPTKFLLTR